MSLLSFVLFFPILGALFLLFIPGWKSQLIKNIALNISLIQLFDISHTLGGI